MRIPPSPPIALVSLSLLAVPVSMADTTDSGTSPVTAQDSCDMRDRLLRYFATCG